MLNIWNDKVQLGVSRKQTSSPFNWMGNYSIKISTMFPLSRREKRRNPSRESSLIVAVLSRVKPNNSNTKIPSPVSVTQNINNQCQTVNNFEEISLLERSDSSRTITSTTDPQIVRKQQQRLLLLRHATRCNYPPGECPIARRCAETKILCHHIRTCNKGRSCPVPHCVSSKYILSHYIRCRGSPSCLVCGPVKRATLKSYKKNHDIARAREIDAKMNVLVSFNHFKKNDGKELHTFAFRYS